MGEEIISYSLRTRANFIRRSYIEDMEKHLLTFENRLIDNNIDVKWVCNEDQLVQTISTFFTKEHFNKFCFDLPEIPYALQNHPAIKHIDIQDFEEYNDAPEYLVVNADFAIVENGTLAFLNKRTQNCFNQVEHLIVLLDLDKLVVKASDLDTLIYLQSYYKNGTWLPSDIKFVQKPFDLIISNDDFGQESNSFSAQNIKITVLLYDNGITERLADPLMRSSLYCIHCNHCRQVCPVYRITRQYSPIELVKSGTEQDAAPLNIAGHTTLCGNCNDACPVMIPFTSLLLKQMEQTRVYKPHSSLLKYFSKRAKMNKLNGWPWRFLFLHKHYGKNSILLDYFQKKKESFFNLWQTPKDSDE